MPAWVGPTFRRRRSGSGVCGRGAGGPNHVLLTDVIAEHIPGCNMAFYKWAFEQVGGFDPEYRKAGDDVDFCWKLQQAGQTTAFTLRDCLALPAIYAQCVS